jgi:hypothetical protein
MPDKVVDTLLDLLLTKENLIIMIASWFLVYIWARVWPELFRKALMVRLQPLLPILLCEALVWLPGLRPAMQWGSTAVLGIVLGWGIGHMHKIGKQSILGNDSRLDAVADAAAPVVPDQPPAPPTNKPA